MCVSYIYCRVPVYCVYVLVIEDFLLLSFKLILGCLFSPHHVNQGGVQKTTRKSLFTNPTLLKSLSGDAELAGTARYCLAMRAKRGNSCWCCFHHMRGSVSLTTSYTRMYAFSSVSPLTEDGSTSIDVLLTPKRSSKTRDPRLSRMRELLVVTERQHFGARVK